MHRRFGYHIVQTQFTAQLLRRADGRNNNARGFVLVFALLQQGELLLPALRERPGDILPLAEYFLGVYADRLDLPLPELSEAAQDALLAHRWPGNTRELENVLHFALLVGQGGVIEVGDLQLPA